MVWRVLRIDLGHTFGVRVDGPPARRLWPPDGGRLCLRVVKGKVLKMDGPSAQGFLGLTGPLAPRVADCLWTHLRCEGS